MVGGSVHTKQAVVFPRIFAQSTQTLKEINLKGNKTHFSDTIIDKSCPSLFVNT